jgi:hypothetical protein
MNLQVQALDSSFCDRASHCPAARLVLIANPKLSYLEINYRAKTSSFFGTAATLA